MCLLIKNCQRSRCTTKHVIVISGHPPPPKDQVVNYWTRCQCGQSALPMYEKMPVDFLSPLRTTCIYVSNWPWSAACQMQVFDLPAKTEQKLIKLALVKQHTTCCEILIQKENTVVQKGCVIDTKVYTSHNWCLIHKEFPNAQMLHCQKTCWVHRLPWLPVHFSKRHKDSIGIIQWMPLIFVLIFLWYTWWIMQAKPWLLPANYSSDCGTSRQHVAIYNRTC